MRLYGIDLFLHGAEAETINRAFLSGTHTPLDEAIYLFSILRLRTNLTEMYMAVADLWLSLTGKMSLHGIITSLHCARRS